MIVSIFSDVIAGRGGMAEGLAASLEGKRAASCLTAGASLSKEMLVE